MWGPANALLEDNLANEQQGLTPRVFERLFARINEVYFLFFFICSWRARRLYMSKCVYCLLCGLAGTNQACG